MLPPSVEHVTFVSCGVDHMRDMQVSNLTALTALAVLESKRSLPRKLRLPPDAAQLMQLRRLSLSTLEVPACLGSLPLLEYLVDQTAITPASMKSLSQLTVLSGGRSTSWCSIYCGFRLNDHLRTVRDSPVETMDACHGPGVRSALHLR